MKEQLSEMFKPDPENLLDISKLRAVKIQTRWTGVRCKIYCMFCGNHKPCLPVSDDNEEAIDCYEEAWACLDCISIAFKNRKEYE